MANKVGLTDAKIAGLKAPAAGQIELADGIVPGLRLRMGASGIKTYILRKRVQGKWLNVTIGRHGPSFTLAHARKKARDLLVDVEQGKSIARKAGAKRKGSKGVGTVAELYETYLAQQIEGKKRSAREFDRVFRKYIEPELGDRLADSITRGDVSRFVEKIAFERGKETLTMARIVYRHLSTFYTWALTRLEHMPANPCRDAWRPKRNEPRDRVLSDRELAALWQSAVEDGYPFGHLVQMLVLTAQRRGEVLDAACDEFDFKAKSGQFRATERKTARRMWCRYPRRPWQSLPRYSWRLASTPTRPTSNPRSCWHRRSPIRTASADYRRPGSASEQAWTRSSAMRPVTSQCMIFDGRRQPVSSVLAYPWWFLRRSSITSQDQLWLASLGSITVTSIPTRNARRWRCGVRR